MERPRGYLTGMIIVSSLSFLVTTSLTILSGGFLFVTVVLVLKVFITSLPMLFLVWRDITALRQRGVYFGSSRWGYYLLTLLLPSYVMTAVYWYLTQGKINDFEKEVEDIESILDEELAELPPLSECRWDRQQMANCSKEELSNILSALVDAWKEDEDETQATEINRLPGKKSEFVGEDEDGTRTFYTTKHNVGQIDDVTKERLLEWVSKRITRAEVEVDVAAIYTNSDVSRDVMVDMIAHNNCLVIGGQLLRRELEAADIPPETILG
jgi:hypothetical protein